MLVLEGALVLISAAQVGNLDLIDVRFPGAEREFGFALIGRNRFDENTRTRCHYFDACRYERQLSVNTVSAYTQDFKRFAKTASPDAVEALELPRVKRHLRELIEEGRLATSTVRRHVASLRALCKHGALEFSLVDPFLRWPPEIRLPNRLPRALDLSTIGAITSPEVRRTQTTQQTVLIVLLLCAKGMRISELCDVQVADLRSDGGSIVGHGEGAKERVVYVGDLPLRRALAALKVDAGSVRGQSGRLLVNRVGNPLQPQAVRKRLHRLRIRSGAEQTITPYTFRHTTTTLLIENGVDIRYVQRLLGHSSITTTQIYTHVTDTALRDAVFSANPIATNGIQE